MRSSYTIDGHGPHEVGLFVRQHPTEDRQCVLGVEQRVVGHAVVHGPDERGLVAVQEVERRRGRAYGHYQLVPGVHHVHDELVEPLGQLLLRRHLHLLRLIAREPALPPEVGGEQVGDLVGDHWPTSWNQ
jgi:hypothetical protein